jgi:hypothetical protein
MRNIRFSDYKWHDILCTNEKDRLAEGNPDMSINKNNGGVLVCGACAVSVSETGETTTSIDKLVSGIKKVLHSHKARA